MRARPVQLERFTSGLRTRRKPSPIHPPEPPLRKGGILECAPSPPYQGGVSPETPLLLEEGPGGGESGWQAKD